MIQTQSSSSSVRQNGRSDPSMPANRGPEVREAGVVGEGDEIDIAQRVPRFGVGADLANHRHPAEVVGQLGDEDREGTFGVRSSVHEGVRVVRIDAEARHQVRILGFPRGTVASVG